MKITEILSEVSRRDFLKGLGAAAGLAATKTASAGFFNTPPDPGDYKIKEARSVWEERSLVNDFKNTHSKTYFGGVLTFTSDKTVSLKIAPGIGLSKLFDNLPFTVTGKTILANGPTKKEQVVDPLTKKTWVRQTTTNFAMSTTSNKFQCVTTTENVSADGKVTAVETRTTTGILD